MKKMAIIFMGLSFLNNGYLIASEKGNDDGRCVYENYCDGKKCVFFGINFKEKSIMKNLPAMSIFSYNCGPEVVTHCVDGLLKGYYRSESCDHVMRQLHNMEIDKNENLVRRWFSSGKYSALYDKIKEKKEEIQPLGGISHNDKVVSDDI